MATDLSCAELEQKLKTLQMYYAVALADSTARYGAEGILDKITVQKKEEQTKNGTALATRFGVTNPCQVFEKTQETYGCANWVCETTEEGFNAIATNCKLCNISKKMGQYSPCQLHCLSPIEAMLKSIAPQAELVVEKTLWDCGKCKVKVVLN